MIAMIKFVKIIKIIKTIEIIEMIEIIEGFWKKRETKKESLRDSGLGFSAAALLALAARIGLLRLDDGGVADPLLHILRLVHPLDPARSRVPAPVVIVRQGGVAARRWRALPAPPAPPAHLAEAPRVVDQRRRRRRLRRHRLLVRRRVDRLVRALGNRLVDVLLRLIPSIKRHTKLLSILKWNSKSQMKDY